MRNIVLLILACLISCGWADGQTLVSRPVRTEMVFPTELTRADVRQLDAWVARMHQWQDMQTNWRNKPKPGLFHFQDRIPLPDPPAWMPRACELWPEPRPQPLQEACLIYANLDRDPDVLLAIMQKQAQIRQKENPSNDRFLWRMHLDGVATEAQLGTHIYGLVGTHMSLVAVRRLQLYGPPGFLLLHYVDTYGRPQWKGAPTWGASLALKDIHSVTIFVNFTHVWLPQAIRSSNSIYQGGSIDLVGLSIAKKKHNEN